MNRIKKLLTFTLVSALIISLLSPLTVSATETETESSIYTYTVKIRVDNPCNSNDMDKDAVNILYFEYNYTTQNGFGAKKTEKFDMTWRNGKNSNADFLKQHFIRPNDNAYDTSFTVDLPGKLNRMHIVLNMDGGERLSFTVKQISCNGITINTNTDYVSSAYNDSEANITCAMSKSLINAASPYFEQSGETALTQTQLNAVLVNLTDDYAGQFVDQFGAVIESSVISKCVGSSDGAINQGLSHSDEAGYYRYTVYVTVENPVNLSDIDGDDVDDFSITFHYKSDNGYGKSGSYCLDMSYDDSLNRNRNPDYLSHFERNNDDGYTTSFSVWVPGVLSKVTCLLNMSSGERLRVNFDKITVNGMAINTDRDYVSSAYWDSEAEIRCHMPSPSIKLTEKTENIADTLKKIDRATMRDQYGALVCDTLFNNALTEPTAYVYRYFDMIK